MFNKVGSFQPALIALIFSFAAHADVAHEAVSVTEIAPNVMVFSTSAGNVVASVGADGALLVGTPSAASTSQIADILASRTRSSVRYVVIFPQDPAHPNGDAGWERLGAFVAMQENALGRLGGHRMGPPQPLPRHLIELGVDRPRVAFSDVLTFDMNGEAIHIVHQPAGYSDADAIAHFHVASLVYLGEVFPGDGYPAADAAQGGNLDGLVKTLEASMGIAAHIVPARGKVADAATVKAFHHMLVSIRDRVRHMIQAGQTEEQVLAAHPTKEFDPDWGHGRVSPDAFVRQIYAELRSR
ncbi:MAG TPA: hypothetical protein VH601_21135 [Bryobacteraceae bacterium]|jgi:hypothetical protein